MHILLEQQHLDQDLDLDLDYINVMYCAVLWYDVDYLDLGSLSASVFSEGKDGRGQGDGRKLKDHDERNNKQSQYIENSNSS